MLERCIFQVSPLKKVREALYQRASKTFFTLIKVSTGFISFAETCRFLNATGGTTPKFNDLTHLSSINLYNLKIYTFIQILSFINKTFVVLYLIIKSFNHCHLVMMGSSDLAGPTHAFQSAGGLTRLGCFAMDNIARMTWDFFYILSSTSILPRLLHMLIVTVFPSAAGEGKSQCAKVIQALT